jgi:hypothetical protein
VTTLQHVRITASGTLGAGGGNEIWSCAHKVALVTDGAPTVPVAATAADLTEIMTSAAAAWTEAITIGFGAGIVASPFSDNVAITLVKASAVAVDGHDDPALSPATYDITASNRGGAPAASTTTQQGQIPYSVAVCVTFRGDLFLRGAAALGRIYFPGPNLYNAALGGAPRNMVDGLMHPDSVGGFLVAAGHILTSIKATTLTSGKNVVPANISTSAAAGGVRWQPITKFIVDNRPDTVRRRSNKIGGLGKAVGVLD